MNIQNFNNLIEFTSHFKDEETCLKYFEQIRFQNGEYCAHCGHTQIYRMKGGKRYRCAECRKDFTIKTGTLFGESKVTIRQWFIAIYLLTTRKKGISSVELAEQVGVTQKTGWFIDHRIREAMKQGKGLLSGTIEIDETYTGGLEKNKHQSKRVKGVQGRSTTTKIPVMGMLQRGGEVRANLLDDVKMKTIEQQITSNIKKGSKIYTDDFLSYSRIKKFYPHEAVKHALAQYVREGNIHSNSIESFWALLKRGYYGTYHKISKKHLQRYIDEFVYRFNNRAFNFDLVFANVVNNISKSATMKYKMLTK